MSSNDVIESYVLEVMRRVPGKERNDIGLELRGLLNEMLAERAQAEARTSDDAMALTLLRDFGTPAEVAARYRSPGFVIIPEDGTRSFALLSIGGIGLQWALTLPRVFDGQLLAAWWLSWGLGALWWPGFLAMTALAAVWIRQAGWLKPMRRGQRTEPEYKIVDPEQINRRVSALGLAWFAIGAAVLIGLPWLVSLMPDPLPQVFAFDPAFLSQRAPPVLLLWLGNFVLLAAVLAHGRWSPALRRLDLAFSAAWLALLGWWLAAGDIFRTDATNDGARAGIGLVILIVVLDLAHKLYRRRMRIRAPEDSI